MTLFQKTSESLEQARLFAWIKSQRKICPELCRTFAIPNGGYRDGRTAARMKMEGTEPGVPDVFCAVARDGYYGLFIELKTVSGRLSDAQISMIGRLRDGGYGVEVCRGHEAAIEALKTYLGI